MKEFGLVQEIDAGELDRGGPIQQRTIYHPKSEIDRHKSQAMGQLKGQASTYHSQARGT